MLLQEMDGEVGERDETQGKEARQRKRSYCARPATGPLGPLPRSPISNACPSRSPRPPRTGEPCVSGVPVRLEGDARPSTLGLTGASRCTLLALGVPRLLAAPPPAAPPATATLNADVLPAARSAMGCSSMRTACAWTFARPDDDVDGSDVPEAETPCEAAVPVSSRTNHDLRGCRR